MTKTLSSLDIEPAMKLHYGSHLAAEGIEPWHLPHEKRAHATGAETMLAITAKTVLCALKEAADE